MKIAIPTTQQNTVDSHFGHCEFFSVYNIDENNAIIGPEKIMSPQECGCKSNIVDSLKNIGVTVMLAGNIGGGAIHVLANNGITVYRGCDGDVLKLVENFIHGNVHDSGETCSHHSHN